MMNMLSNIVRAEGDPKVLHTGPGSLSIADRLGRSLGWVGMGLGVAELLFARRITAALGIASGVLTLSVDTDAGLWTRIAGDALDIAALAAALNKRDANRGAVGMALAMVVGITMLDIVAAEEVTRRHARPSKPRQTYSDRSGFPQGLEAARGAVSARETEKIPQHANAQGGAGNEQQ
jgi:hypothetical protein